MVEEQRRFEDSGKRGMDDPLVLLGQLHSRVGRLEQDTAAQTSLLQQISSTLTTIQIQYAGDAGTRRGIKAVWKIGEVILTICIAFASAWAAVKTIGHGP